MRELTYDEARALTNRIKHSMEDVLDLIATAFEGRADVALGYDRWDRYCYAEFPLIRFGNRAVRAKAVARLREQMSCRAIGSALGMDESTVRKDLLRHGNAQPRGAGNPAPGNSTRGLDGGMYPRRSQPPPCKPVAIQATITTALVAYARQAATVVADLDAQHYPPGFLTPAELRAVTRFRTAVADFRQTAEAEHAARLAREEQA